MRVYQKRAQSMSAKELQVDFENAQFVALEVLSAGRDIMQLRKVKHTCTV